MPMPLLNKYTSIYKKALAEDPNHQELNNSIAMCYLKLGLHDKALVAFERAMEDNFDNSETFFYAAICLLGGKKAFLARRTTIDKIEEYVNAAMMIEPRGMYHYFLAYVKYDFYERKSLNTKPSYREMLGMANASGVSQFDIEQLYEVLGVARPEIL
jgi:tetratricopeptide (TPR) repeat protein